MIEHVKGGTPSGAAVKLGSSRWYREPWPWFLMGLPALAVLAGVVTLFIAIRSDDGLVADDYYRQGLGINRAIARQHLAAALELEAVVMKVKDNMISVELKGREGISFPRKLRLSFSHPTRAVEDQGVVLERVGTSYLGFFTVPASGRRDIVLEDIERTWRLSKSVVLPLRGPVSIVAQRADSASQSVAQSSGVVR